MVTRKLEIIFLISLALIYLHGLEEIITGFQSMDSFMVFGASFLKITPESFYWISHLVWWIAVPVLFILFKKSLFILPLMSLYGFVFVVEIHHIVKAFVAWGYYHGLVTVLFYPIVGLFYWLELVKNWKKLPKKQ